MGINIILPLIIGMALMVSLGSQVVPSFVEQMKVAKVENRTISNQNLIKDAIVRYIKMEKKVPKDNDLKVLKDYGLLRDYHESNIFGGGYGFNIDKKKGILKIFTTINDEDAGKYFSNSFKFPNAPTCIEFGQNGACTGKFETFYLLDEDTFKSIPIPEVGSIEDIQDRFTKVEEVGKKFDEATLVGGEKDYIVDLVTKEVTEYTYDKGNDKWVENPTKIVVPSLNPYDHGVEIKNIIWDFIDGLGNKIKQTHEKVYCEKTTLSNIEVFVVNQNTGLGEIVWVAPNNISVIQNKIFGVGHHQTSPVVYTPNNICTSKVINMQKMFFEKTTFNVPLNRWDTSKVTNMSNMFQAALVFNQTLSFDTRNVYFISNMFYVARVFNNGCLENNFSCPLNFDTSKVTDMYLMFYYAERFNQSLNFDTSNVTAIQQMFSSAKKFNQPLNFNTSNVTDMNSMFNNATNFNQDLSSWCVSKIGSKQINFDSNTPAWPKTLNADNKIALQPQWGKPCP